MKPYELGTAIQECLAHAGPSDKYDTDCIRFVPGNGILSVIGTDTRHMFRRTFDATDAGAGLGGEFSMPRADAECLVPALMAGRTVEFFSDGDTVRVVTRLAGNRQELTLSSCQRFPNWRLALHDHGYVGVGTTTCQQMLDFVRVGTVRIGAADGAVHVGGRIGSWFDARLVRSVCVSIGLTSTGSLSVQQLGPHNATGKPGPIRLWSQSSEAWVAALDITEEKREAA